MVLRGDETQRPLSTLLVSPTWHTRRKPICRVSQRIFSVELIEKTKERSGYLVRRLLLNPVALAVNNGGASKVRTVRPRRGVEINARYKRPNRIEASRNEGAGLMDLKPGQLRNEFPVSSLSAVSVERTAKATPLECGGEVVEICFRHP